MKMKTAFKASLLAMTFFCLATVLHAAPPGGPGNDPDPGTKVPFDFGISIMIAAGVGYAAKKRHDAKKQQQEGTVSEK